MPVLAAEGGDARNLARLASRLGRANAAVEVLVDGAERYLALRDPSLRGLAPRGLSSRGRGALPQGPGIRIFDARTFAAMPEEIRLRLLLRAIDQIGHEGPAELGKVEALLSALDRAVAASTRASRSNLKGRLKPKAKLKQTLAGALVSLIDGRISIAPAPPRRRRPD
jgi:tRNA(Ile)-lysidine synthase